ncbi:ANTAR domain-containing protein [Desulfoferula mesophila]|uniref:ANTAR domain-containing protein n=1 Tax=Desulfoferula mesophila TaxID=3058419 RepID=UPI0030CFE9FA
MTQLKVALVQQPNSPLAAGLAPILAGCEVAVLSPDPPQTLPPLVSAGEMLVLWDLHGFAPPQLAAWEKILAAEEVGVVLAAPAGMKGLAELAAACGALALITPSQDRSQSRLQLAAAGALQARLRELLEQTQELETRLSEREIIEKAKNLLILNLGLGEPEALRRLQQHARRSNQKLVQVARQVLAAYHLFNGDKP